MRWTQGRLAGLSVAVGMVAVVTLGLLAGNALNRALGISFGDKELPSIAAVPDAPVQSPIDPVRPFDHIVLPEDSVAARLYARAAEDLAHVLEERSGRTPALAFGMSPRSGRSVVVRADEGAGQSVRIYSRGPTVVISASSPAGAAFGMNRLSTMLRGPLDDRELAVLDRVLEPALAVRLVDSGAVGEVPDTAAWTSGDYTHHGRGLRGALLDDPPFVDQGELNRVSRQFRDYLDRMAMYGYGGIVMGGFLRYVNFDYVGSGYDVYPPDSPYRVRHVAQREALRDLMDYAEHIGFSIILSTDMLALSTPLERYLSSGGSLDPSDPSLWEVYRLGLRELFDVMPQVDGLMIRVGEAGTVYDVAGSGYYSRLAVREAPHVRSMLRAFCEVAGSYGKIIILRNWTVGVGGIGDMHTNPATYDLVLDDLTEPALFVSTKYVNGDYYSYLPLNATLATGEQPRIIEFQARREFEGFASFPNFLAPTHQQALLEHRRSNRHVAGMWMWTQGGGPVRQSPMSLYPFHGFWQLIDADVYVSGQLAWDPEADVRSLTSAWVQRAFGSDPSATRTITQLLLDSRRAVVAGMYVEPFAQREVRAFGLEPPPMMWIFEWDILTASSAVLSAIYYSARDDVGGAIASGYAAVDHVRRLQDALATIEEGAVDSVGLLDALGRSTAYEASLFETLADYRATVLSYYAWLDSGDAHLHANWRAALERFESSRAEHVEVYATDLDFRALSFFDVDAGLVHARRSVGMMWLARLLLVLLAATFAAGFVLGADQREKHSEGRSLRALSLGAFTPWRAVDVGLTATFDRVVVVLWPVLFAMLAVLALTSFASAAVVVAAAGSLFVAYVLVGTVAASSARVETMAAFGGWLLASTAFPLAVVAVRGPLYLWYQLWTSDLFRMVLGIHLAVTLAWFVVSLWTTERARGRTALDVVGHLLLIAGGPVLLLGIGLRAVGLERALTLLNDRLVILPLGLSRILGITTHLNIPLGLPLSIIGAGSLAIIAGTVFLLVSRHAVWQLEAAHGVAHRD